MKAEKNAGPEDFRAGILSARSEAINEIPGTVHSPGELRSEKASRGISRLLKRSSGSIFPFMQPWENDTKIPGREYSRISQPGISR